MNELFDFAIIGGGAAGLFALRGLRDKRVIVIERNERLGAKLLTTGGGKCNFTNRSVSHFNYLSSNPHFVKSALARFTPNDMLDIISRHKIAIEERDNGKLFTIAGADKILDMLLKDGENKQCKFMTGTTLKDIRHEGDGFRIITDKGDIAAEKVVIATGGLSIPKLGSTGIGYKIAEKFGMKVIPHAPALTTLTYPQGEEEIFSSLSGISITAEFTIGKKKIKDELLFTHSGFSGPLALNVSLYCAEGADVLINFAPHIDIRNIINDNRSSKKSLNTLLSYHIPKALAKVILKDSDYDLSKIKKSEVESVIELVHNRKSLIKPLGGYGKAEVTLGGVSVDDIYPSNMESRKRSGLYFIGEVLDVTGELGGYNLHWAWASANAFLEGQY